LEATRPFRLLIGSTALPSEREGGADFRDAGAVREAKGERAAHAIPHLKKGEMAEKAQALLAGSGWLPEPLRTPGKPIAASTQNEAEPEPDEGLDFAGVETAADGCETAMVEPEASDQGEPVLAEPPVAAE
jgi:ParB family transcriptional regulator, chromosome partitioning protein